MEENSIFALKEIFGFVVAKYTETRTMIIDGHTHTIDLPILSNKLFTIVKFNNNYFISKNYKQLFMTSDINELILYIDKYLPHLRVNQ